MIIEFSVGNFWSFKKIQTLQMQAAKIVSKFPEVDEKNVIPVNEQLFLLKSKAIFGANASGKTNLVRAMVAMVFIVAECLKDMEALRKKIVPFFLDEATLAAPSFFQVMFIIDNTQFRYGFEATHDEIVSEWLFGKDLRKNKQSRERYYFTREKMKVSINETAYKEGKQFTNLKKGTPPLYRENSLFLSVVAAWNGKLAKKITEYLQTGFTILSGLDDEMAINVALNSMSHPVFQKRSTELLQAIDPTIQRVERVEVDMNSLSAGNEEKQSAEEFRKRKQKFGGIVVIRKQKGKGNKDVPLMLSTQEAEGTKKLFSLSPFIFGTLERGKTLVIDEFDARMHPRLTRKIIELFHSPDTNPNNAQLIFISHDTNLLDAKLLRRDQISFAQKDKDGATELYSLVEFKGVRNDASFEKDYLLGKYNAVPSNLNVLEETLRL